MTATVYIGKGSEAKRRHLQPQSYVRLLLHLLTLLPQVPPKYYSCKERFVSWGQIQLAAVWYS